MSRVFDEQIIARIGAARSFLFVPGDVPERISKALASVADAVIVDLEDGVREEQKSLARSLLSDIGAGHKPLLLVRVNATSTENFLLDVDSAIAAGADALVIPKFTATEQMNELETLLDTAEAKTRRKHKVPIIGLIESSAGVLSLIQTSELSERVVRLAFGSADLHTDLGIPYQKAGVQSDVAMAIIVLASAAHSLASPIDSPYFGLEDLDGLKLSVERAQGIGFRGKLCIHPNQLSIVVNGFKATEEDRAWAARVMQEWNNPARNGAGAIRLGDELIDEAMVRRARQVIELI